MCIKNYLFLNLHMFLLMLEQQLQKGTLPKDYKIQVHLKKWNIMKKVNIFCHSFQKVKPIYYIDALHIEGNISSLYFLIFWWLWLSDNENPKFSVSEN